LTAFPADSVGVPADGTRASTALGWLHRAAESTVQFCRLCCNLGNPSLCNEGSRPRTVFWNSETSNGGRDVVQVLKYYKPGGPFSASRKDCREDKRGEATKKKRPRPADTSGAAPQQMRGHLMPLVDIIPHTASPRIEGWCVVLCKWRLCLGDRAQAARQRLEERGARL